MRTPASGAPYPSVQGARQHMNTQPFGGNVTLRPTQLIREQHLPMGQYLVTLMPPTTASGITPYVSTFDGGVFPAVPPAIYSAPLLPDQPAALQVAVSWGAGGIRYQTAFDYPANGGTFSITCDRMDVNVGVKGDQAIAYTPDQVPHIGAFFVLGAPVDDTPMAWLEQGLNINAAASASWAVKPFAKELLLYVESLITSVRIEWLNTRNITLVQIDQAPTVGNTSILRLDVPRQATVVRITNRGAAAGAVFLEWGIGLS